MNIGEEGEEDEGYCSGSLSDADGLDDYISQLVRAFG